MPVTAVDPFAGRSGNPIGVFDNFDFDTPSDDDELPFIASRIIVRPGNEAQMNSNIKVTTAGGQVLILPVKTFFWSPDLSHNIVFPLRIRKIWLSDTALKTTGPGEQVTYEWPEILAFW